MRYAKNPTREERAREKAMEAKAAEFFRSYEYCKDKEEWELAKEALYIERGRAGHHHCGGLYSVEDSARYAHGAAARLWSEAAYMAGKSWIEPKIVARAVRKAEKQSQAGREADLAYHGCMAEIERMAAKRSERKNPGRRGR